jgi:hypothetical protein
LASVYENMACAINADIRREVPHRSFVLGKLVVNRPHI